MQEPAPTGIIQSTEQSAKDLHRNIRKPLDELGHKGSTVPPQEAPVLTKEMTQWVEDKTNDVVHIAHTTINPDEEAKIRFANKKTPISITAGRWFKKNLLNRKAA